MIGIGINFMISGKTNLMSVWSDATIISIGIALLLKLAPLWGCIKPYWDYHKGILDCEGLLFYWFSFDFNTIHFRYNTDDLAKYCQHTTHSLPVKKKYRWLSARLQ